VPCGKHIEAYVELQELQKEGFVKSIGISNYVIEVCVCVNIVYEEEEEEEEEEWDHGYAVKCYGGT
jgi:hypothetical protein